MYNTSQVRPENDHRKPCTLCGKLCDVRVRCQIDETGTWHLICPGKCWTDVSSGVTDGDGADEHKYYRYGGMWKNKHDAVSAKKPRKKSKESRMEDEVEVGGQEEHAKKGHGEWSGHGVKYTRNDEVMFEGELWICRKSHVSEEGKSPREMKNLWKEAVAWKEED